MSKFHKNSQSNIDAVLFSLSLDRDADSPLSAQLTDAIRAAVLSGTARAGERVPPSRILAQEMSVSRMTVTTAYDQLISEGYLEARRGAGTFIAADPPHLVMPARTISRTPASPEPWRVFHPGLPDAALFPHRQWARCLEQVWRSPDPALLIRPDPFGWYPLRAAIAEHLAIWRNLDCVPDQIVMTAGALESVEIICRAILPPGSRVAVEDPGWPPLNVSLERFGAVAAPVRIDAEGLDAAAMAPDAAAVIVTPSRQYPTGAAMPLARRLALLEWARGNGALVIEDDYDSEYRYKGQPLPSLSGLDGLQECIYLGSFSKLLSPMLRLGYMVLPERLIAPVRRYLDRFAPRASLVPQPALAAFMDSGAFAMHLRRTRRIYARRQSRLLEGLAGTSGFTQITNISSGMHLCAFLHPAFEKLVSDTELVGRARGEGLDPGVLSRHCILPDPPQGILLGFCPFDEETLTVGAKRLSDLLMRVSSGR